MWHTENIRLLCRPCLFCQEEWGLHIDSTTINHEELTFPSAESLWDAWTLIARDFPFKPLFDSKSAYLYDGINEVEA